MKFHTIDNFGFKLADVIPLNGDFVAAGIAMSSEVDTCLIGQHRLAPLGLVPCSPGMAITAVRGYRTGSTTSLGAGPPRIGGTLVLQLYERGDLLMPPGPRAPIVLSGRVASIGTLVTAPTLLARVPFMGRSSAVVCVSRVDADTTDANVIIRGVRYLTSAERAGDATPDQGYIAEQTTTLWGGAAAQPVSVITATDKTGLLTYVGGEGDFEESYDELEVWAYGTATPGLNWQVEVTGERGR